MKSYSMQRILALLTGMALASAMHAAQAKLTVGDPAPKLQTGQWVQGDPVTHFDSNHVYIVEFWATWCGPCRASIPHLNELWQKFKDQGLIAIGQDVWEENDSGVASFVKGTGDKMTYRVALDDKRQDKEGAMATTWMKAADQNGIPTAFIVNRQGRIAWIGHPMGLTEQTLEDILAGRFDVAKFAAEYESQQKAMAKQTELTKKLNAAIENKDWDAADAAVAGLKEVEPARAEGLEIVRLAILLGRKNYTEARKLAESLSDAHPDKAGRQNDIAWTMALQKELDKPTLALAEKIAMRANDAAKGNDPAILDTLARLQFMSGKEKEAIATEQKAVALAPDRQKALYRKFLDDYQAGKLPELGD